MKQGFTAARRAVHANTKCSLSTAVLYTTASPGGIKRAAAQRLGEQASAAF
jgi:hypothetical protein